MSPTKPAAAKKPQPRSRRKKPAAAKATDQEDRRPQARGQARHRAADRKTSTTASVVKRTRGKKLWGGETDKAVANFPVSGHPMPLPVIR